MELDELLRLAVQRGASDLHLKPMRPPLVRIQGKLIPIDEGEPLLPETLTSMLLGILTPQQRKRLETHMAVDIGYGVKGLSRFRGNIYVQRGTYSAAFRRIPYEIKTIKELELPEVLYEFCQPKAGLILVTGATSMGKSTTLAAMISHIAETRNIHVVTIEDPIEFLFSDKKASISQREVSTDTPSFAEALRNCMRQDPDVIMVGEMRDAETMATVMTAAETGHLVFSTLHTNSAAQTIDRIMDTFPADQQEQVRHQLATVLYAIVSLRLVPRKDGSGMVAACEILKNSPRIMKLIQEGNIKEIEQEIESSVAHFRMQSMNQSLIALLVNGVIDYQTAMEASPEPEELNLQLRKLFPHLEERKEDTMPSPADFSELQKLMGIKKLYEEQEEKFRLVLAEKEELIQQLEEDLQRLRQQMQEQGGSTQALKEALMKERKQRELLEKEYKQRIAALQERVRALNQELMQLKQEPRKSGGGFFKRS